MQLNDLKHKKIGYLASGGLDSCTVVHWLSSNNVEVICFVGDLGQPDEPDLQAVKQRMLDCGAR